MDSELSDCSKFEQAPITTVGDRTVALNIIARCSITQTPPDSRQFGDYMLGKWS